MSDYTDSMLEEIRKQNKAALEAVTGMQQHVAQIPKIQDGITSLKQDIQVVKAAVIDTSNELCKLDHRVTRLEVA